MTAESPQAFPTGGAHRVAWFSPMPPSSSGIAAYSAEIVPGLRARGLAIDVYVEPLDGPDAADGRAGARRLRVAAPARRRTTWSSTSSATPPATTTCGATCSATRGWSSCTTPRCTRRARSPCWAAGRRAATTTCTSSPPTIPTRPPTSRLLIAEGLGGSLFGHWPLVRLVLQAARLAAVHSPALAARLAERYGVEVQAVPMGVADPLAATGGLSAGEVRARHGLQPDDVVIGAFGGLTPEKRLPQVIEAVAGLAADRPNLHLLLVGSPARHYDVGRRRAAAGHRRAGSPRRVRLRRRPAGVHAGGRHRRVPPLAHQRRDVGLVAAG